MGLIKRGCLMLAVTAAFTLVSMLGVQAEPVSEETTWSGVYFGIGVGSSSFGYDLEGDAQRSKSVRERDCYDQTEDGGCLDPDEWFEIADWWFEERSNGEDENYNYSRDINFSDDIKSIFGTVQLGYDQQMGSKVVVGLFADYDLYEGEESNFSSSWDTLLRSHEVTGAISGDVELNNVWSVGGRIGTLVSPRFLLYGVGGYTQAGLNGDLILTTNDLEADSLSASLPETLHGYFVGAGGEYRFNEAMSLKVEYRYSDYNEVDFSASKSHVSHDVHPNGQSTLEHENTHTRGVSGVFNADLHSVRAVLVVRLGTEIESPIPVLMPATPLLMPTAPLK